MKWLAKMNRFMKIAKEEAEKGIRLNEGGPFGAVIVKDGKIIARAHNKVIKTNDPTSHAEINAIREASKKLNRFNLSGCEIYSSCEPCPMCLSAIYWAKISKLYYGCTKEDAEKINFNDKFIYNMINRKPNKRQIREIQINREDCLKSFKMWKDKEDKVQY
jgi:guanine deaminase